MKYFEIIKDKETGKVKFNPFSFVENQYAVKELIESRLKIIKGELKYNIRLGIPIGYNKTEIDLNISDIILSTSGVSKIIKFESKVENRKYSANIDVQTEFSGIIKVIV